MHVPESSENRRAIFAECQHIHIAHKMGIYLIPQTWLYLIVEVVNQNGPEAL
jgi:hypothetical protein